MLGKEIEQVNEFFKLVDGKHDGRVAWNRIKTALAELGTTPNTGSPKLFTTCTECPLRWICSHDVAMKSPTCIDARKQLRAGA